MWVVLARVAALVAILASTALYVQYLEPSSAAFCGLDSGCETVRRSVKSYFFGTPFVSIPLFGLIAYAGALAASVWEPRSRVTRLLFIGGGAVGVVLFGVQAFYVKAFCWLCSVVDVAAIFGACSVILDARSGSVATHDPLRLWAWLCLAGLVVSAPALWIVVMPAAPLPAGIRALYEPGKINVVEFADFECPFCRKFHFVLKDVIRSYPPGEVHFQRRHVPLPMHENALPAARADVCAEEQGKADVLADRLVDIDLSPTSIHRTAVEVGVDGAKLDRCLGSSEPDRRIAADTKLLNDAGMEGLPTTYVGEQRLLGAVSEETVRDAFEKAKRQSGPGGVPGPWYLAGLLAAVGAVVWLGRSSRGTVRDAK
jgi:predicted DsbA family dithiol-disulfide isomerase/uncharacterized membrane protein